MNCVASHVQRRLQKIVSHPKLFNIGFVRFILVLWKTPEILVYVTIFLKPVLNFSQFLIRIFKLSPVIAFNVTSYMFQIVNYTFNCIHSVLDLLHGTPVFTIVMVELGRRTIRCMLWLNGPLISIEFMSRATISDWYDGRKYDKYM